ncbi:unnamed protein product [Caenorhabditis auriculariae]|uniref:Transthyretin-like family protein n=1 Tax=Caenorhabditis auriculariae TaxID=2777116 RepID=A0A8S1HH78_9PELO|nr:unnamed protein product [Caenorhabditis auriculariae]
MSRAILILALFGSAAAMLDQSIAVEGRLMCGPKPASGVRIKLWEEDTGPDPDDLLDEGYTNADGEFKLGGYTAELTPIDPIFKVYHDCDDGIKPGSRKVKFALPKSYITKGQTPKKVFNIGVLNLETIFPKEERELIVTRRRRDHNHYDDPKVHKTARHNNENRYDDYGERHHNRRAVLVDEPGTLHHTARSTMVVHDENDANLLGGRRPNVAPEYEGKRVIAINYADPDSANVLTGQHTELLVKPDTVPRDATVFVDAERRQVVRADRTDLGTIAEERRREAEAEAADRANLRRAEVARVTEDSSSEEVVDRKSQRRYF